MQTIEDLLVLCNLEQRLLVERVVSLVQTRIDAAEETLQDAKTKEEDLRYLMNEFFNDHIRTNFDGVADWNRWRDRKLEQRTVVARHEAERKNR